MSQRLRRVARYGAVGLLTLAVYLASGHALHAMRVQSEWLAVLPFMLAVAVQYPLQRSWVFRDSQPVRLTVSRFACMVAAGLALNAMVLVTLMPLVGLLAGQVLAAGVVVAFNAAASFLWVFFRSSAA